MTSQSTIPFRTVEDHDDCDGFGCMTIHTLGDPLNVPICRWSVVPECVIAPRSGAPEPDVAQFLSVMVPLRYHSDMAMNLRLTDAESEALRKKAEQEGRSMQEVARAAIAQYVSERPQRLRAAIDRVRSEDSELLERLSRCAPRSWTTSRSRTFWRSHPGCSTTSR